MALHPVYRFIKICGLTNTDDARAAVLMGADILGMVMHAKSPRYCRPENVYEISRDFYFKPKVFVFADDDIEYAQYLIGEFGDELSFIQVPVHTNLFQWALGKFSTGKILPVISITENLKPSALNEFREYPWVIFDTGGIKSAMGEELYGGTGQTFDWSILAGLNRKYFLAGGLNPANIYLAITMTNASGFDVSSGIEKEPGKKDYELMNRFIEIVRKT